MSIIRVFKTCTDSKVLSAAKDCLLTGLVAAGPSVPELQEQFASLHNKKYAVGFSDMTSAIESLLRVIGVKEGDLVLCHSYSCLSTTMAIAQVGAKPLWVDLEEDSPRICLEDFTAKIPMAKAALVYNIAGFNSDIKSIEAVCKKNDVVLINDCNNASLTVLEGKFLGEYGDYSIHSFYPNRDLSGIDGGMIVTNEETSLDLKLHQRFGIDPLRYRDNNGEISESYSVDTIAGSNNLTNICAAMVLAQLENIPMHQDYKTEVFRDIYSSLPAEMRFNCEPHSDCKIVPWAIPIKCSDPLILKKLLAEKGVQSTRLHFPNNNYEIFGRSETLKNTKTFYDSCIWVPVNKKLQDILKVKEF